MKHPQTKDIKECRGYSELGWQKEIEDCVKVYEKLRYISSGIIENCRKKLSYGSRRVHRLFLRNVENGFWRHVRAKAILEGKDVKEIILEALRNFVIEEPL